MFADRHILLDTRVSRSIWMIWILTLHLFISSDLTWGHIFLFSFRSPLQQRLRCLVQECHVCFEEVEDGGLMRGRYTYRWSRWSFPTRTASCWRAAGSRWRIAGSRWSRHQFHWKGFGWCLWTDSSATRSWSGSAALWCTEGPALPLSVLLTVSLTLLILKVWLCLLLNMLFLLTRG